MLASLERGRELFEAGAITNVEFQALKQKLLKQARVQPAIAEAVCVAALAQCRPVSPEHAPERRRGCATRSLQERAENTEVAELRAKERARRESALALARKTQAELERESAPLLEVTGWLDDWCANFDAITIGRCAQCELGTNFSRVATMARQAKARMLVAVKALAATRSERLQLHDAVAELQDMVSEQDSIVQDEQEGRQIVAQSMRETFATLAEAQAAVAELVSPLRSRDHTAWRTSHQFLLRRRALVWSQRATIAEKNDAIASATVREQALQKKLDEVSSEALRKESAQSARILDLETQLSVTTADLERQVGSCTCYVLSNFMFRHQLAGLLLTISPRRMPSLAAHHKCNTERCSCTVSTDSLGSLHRRREQLCSLSMIRLRPSWRN
jgi:hypothetical protein